MNQRRRWMLSIILVLTVVGGAQVGESMPQFAGEMEFYNEDWSEQVGWVMWQCTGTRHDWGYPTPNMIVIDPPYSCDGLMCSEPSAENCIWSPPSAYTCVAMNWGNCS